MAKRVKAHPRSSQVDMSVRVLAEFEEIERRRAENVLKGSSTTVQ